MEAGRSCREITGFATAAEGDGQKPEPGASGFNLPRDTHLRVEGLSGGITVHAKPLSVISSRSIAVSP